MCPSFFSGRSGLRGFYELATALAHAGRMGDSIVLLARGRPARGGPRWLAPVTLGAGVVVAGVGGLLLGLAYGVLGQLGSPQVPMNAMMIQAAVATGRGEQWSGIALLGLGGAIAAVGAVLFGVYDVGVPVSATVAPTGAAVSFRVPWP